MRDGIKKYHDVKIQHEDRFACAECTDDAPKARNGGMRAISRPTGEHTGGKTSVKKRKDDIPNRLVDELIAYLRCMDRELIHATAKADVCAVLVRLALERRVINETNYFALAEGLREIAKMTIGWRKSLGR